MYFALLNPQGNFDAADSNWTMHPDFGGQLVYVKELALALSSFGHSVDIFTRSYHDPKFPMFAERFDHYSDNDLVRIVRLPCGGNDFIRKEDLWPHLKEWTDNIVDFLQEENLHPDFLAGHYGDGGLSTAMISQKLRIPFSFTAHSLGAQKLDKLSNLDIDSDTLERTYHFKTRILAENTCITYADVIYVSTSQEKEEQYRHPLYIDSTSKNVDSFVIAPPGANTKVFTDRACPSDPSRFKRFDSIVARDIDKSRRRLPFVVMASRLDPKKNHIGLLKAYAGDKELQARANIAISLRGIEDAFRDSSSGNPAEREVLDSILDEIRQSDLRGKVMLISITGQDELASFYRYCAKLSSVFALVSLYEPFGLAPIEAMSAGLVAVATKNGGPASIMRKGSKRFGVLVDPEDPDSIASGVLAAIAKYDVLRKEGRKRVIEDYTWQNTAEKYLYGFSMAITRGRKPIGIPRIFL